MNAQEAWLFGVAQARALSRTTRSEVQRYLTYRGLNLPGAGDEALLEARSEFPASYALGLLDEGGSVSVPSAQASAGPAIGFEGTDNDEAFCSALGLDGPVGSLSGVATLDLLGRLYESAGPRTPEGEQLFRLWCTHVAEGSAEQPLSFEYQLLEAGAAAPLKSRVSDSGYDLTAIAVRKSWGEVTLYGTGISVAPPEGWYFDVVPRSSISKSGYMLANSVGVIDRAYRGELMIPMRKVVADAPDIELPSRVAQLIPRQIVHMQPRLVNALDVTARGDGGFGSTGK